MHASESYCNDDPLPHANPSFHNIKLFYLIFRSLNILASILISFPAAKPCLVPFGPVIVGRECQLFLEDSIGTEAGTAVDFEHLFLSVSLPLYIYFLCQLSHRWVAGGPQTPSECDRPRQGGRGLRQSNAEQRTTTTREEKDTVRHRTLKTRFDFFSFYSRLEQRSRKTELRKVKAKLFFPQTCYKLQDNIIFSTRPY